MTSTPSKSLAWIWITPYTPPSETCLSVPSGGVVYAISDDLVIKLPFQFLIPIDLPDNEQACVFHRDLGLRSFELLHNESTLYEILSANPPHRNIVRKLFGGSESGLVLERIASKLSEVHEGASTETRHRWLLELVSALSWLEQLGYTHGDLAVRNILVDKDSRLKLSDFDQATRNDHEYFNSTVEEDHSGLATCLHFILSGIDPIASSGRDFRKVKQQMHDGKYEVHAEAEILGDIIRAGWTGRLMGRSFAQIEQDVISALKTESERKLGLISRLFAQVYPATLLRLKNLLWGVDGAEIEPSNAQAPELDVRQMRQTYDAWLDTVETDQQWKDEEEYRLAWKAVGLEGTKGEWSVL
ncbi:MAG: hypothetical protein M1837_006704 [Sclerophora amabilis]|nr:MAG: hypothetical protein M1837_006704 [Sclerophora amabilis]